MKTAPVAVAPKPVEAAHGHRPETPLICVFLVFAAVVAYGGLCRDEYQFFNIDDPAYVTQNPQVQAGLTAESFYWALTTFHANNWHPLTWLSLQLDYTLHGLAPSGYHLTNLLLHAANAVLLFLLLRSLTGAVWRSAFVAALFLLHPQRVESVAWIAERKDVLCAFFGILTLWAYVGFVRRPSVGQYLLILTAFTLGLMAKQMLVTLPCVMLLLDYWPLQRAGWKSLIVEKLPLFALSAAACVITMYAQAAYRQPVEDYPLGIRGLNALVAYVSYLGKMLWPAELCFYYPHPGPSLPVWQGVAAGLALAGLTWLFVVGPGRSRRYLAVGWLWYLGMLVPVIGLVQVGMQAYADRYTYLPMIGIYLMITWGVAEFAERRNWPVRAVGIAAGTALFACLVLTWIQVGTWKTPRSVWEQVVKVEPRSFKARSGYAQLLANEGKGEAAVMQFLEAIALEPNADIPHLRLGILLHGLQQYDDAATHFEKVLQIDPGSVEAHFWLGSCAQLSGNLTKAVEHYTLFAQAFPDMAEARNHLGTVLLFQGKVTDADRQLTKSLELAPRTADTLTKLGLLLELQAQHRAAADRFRQAIAINPKDPSPVFYLAWSLHVQGETDAARKQFAAAMALNPNWPRSTARSAMFLASHPDAGNRNGPLALLQAQVANQAVSTPDPELLDILAAAYAEVAQFPEAVAAARKAVELSEPSSELKADREKRLKLYENREPFRHSEPIR